MKTKKQFATAIAAIALAFAIYSFPLMAQTHGHEDMKPGTHIMVSPEQIKWQDGPPSLPPGSKFAVIEGDVKKEGLFTMRLKFPAGYVVPGHWHPVDEHVTVIKGSFKMGMGEKFERKDLQVLSEGSFAVMPAKAGHFAASDEECILQVHAQGPWVITYFNPADDPRKK